ncbi:hypothetical protein BH10PLA2_BH10PLA2_12750 [soil metagenome]
MLKGATVVLLALVAFAPLAFCIQHYYAEKTIDISAAASIFVVPQECRPEPGERLTYLIGLFCLPLAIFGFARLANRINWPNFADHSLLRHLGWLIVTGGLVGFACFAASGDKDDQGSGYYHIRLNFARAHPLSLLFVPLVIGVGLRWQCRDEFRSRWYWPLLLAVASVPLVGSVFVEHWPYANQWHFNAVFDSSVRLHFGKTLLVDSTSQYGLFAWFLQPLFRVTGLSVAKFTFVMGMLSATAYLLIGLFLKRMTNRPLLAAIGLTATLFNGWMLFLTVEGPHRGKYFDLYFQYVPLRLIFPALMLAMGSCWLVRPSRALSRGIWLMLSCGVLWNLDSGAPAAAAWVFLLMYFETEPGRPNGRLRRLCRQAVAGLAALCGVLSVHALSTWHAAGAWPNYSLMFRSQAIFYAHGFGMLPMPWPGTWMVVVAIYLIGLTYAACAHAQGGCDNRARGLFLISILGLLLFSYYQGRSHRAVLILAWWPAFPALTLLLDVLLDHVAGLGKRFSLAGLVACLPAAILFGSVASFCEYLPFVGAGAGKQLAGVLHVEPMPFNVDADLVRQHALQNRPLWIISPRESVLHLATKSPEIAPCSFNELLLLADYAPLAQRLEATPDADIWIDRLELEAALPVHSGIRFVADLLARSYEPVAIGERGWLFRRRIVEKANLITAIMSNKRRTEEKGTGTSSTQSQSPILP